MDINNCTLQDLVEIGFHERASDVCVKVGAQPTMRQHSVFQPLKGGPWPVVDEKLAKKLIYGVMSEKQQRVFEETFEMDLAFSVKDLCRVRANIYWQRGTPAIVCRIIPLKIFTIEELGLPPVLKEFTKHSLRLVLVTGPTGSGKTTSLAAMIDLINQQRPCHIVTIEDPLEFVHQDKTAYISQREVHIDTGDFQPALRAVVREAPDVILIGEMRDPETMSTALQAGETGTLVFSTVHPRP